ncbi:MAG: methionyl-tRNA formyltransferase, partial [Opitutae bacterium]|nr:methionyl-tRNA formyltransferase [Opitutae bacterium]
MSELPNIVFFGSDAICLPVLNYLQHEAADECVLRAVVSQPDRRQGRGKKLQPNPVAAWAAENGVELLQPESPTRELAQWLATEQTAVSLVMTYGHFLQKALREAAPQGMWNFHGSLLPNYRGASPVETALASGDTETGVGLMQVVKEMDAGAVADVEVVHIGELD